jgi:hypothetical protein
MATRRLAIVGVLSLVLFAAGFLWKAWRTGGESASPDSTASSARNVIKVTPRGTDVPFPPYTKLDFYPKRGKQIILTFPNGQECEARWEGDVYRLMSKDDPKTPCEFWQPLGWVNVRSKTGEVEVEVVKEPLPRP